MATWTEAFRCDQCGWRINLLCVFVNTVLNTCSTAVFLHNSHIVYQNNDDDGKISNTSTSEHLKAACVFGNVRLMTWNNLKA